MHVCVCDRAPWMRMTSDTMWEPPPFFARMLMVWMPKAVVDPLRTPVVLDSVKPAGSVPAMTSQLCTEPWLIVGST